MIFALSSCTDYRDYPYKTKGIIETAAFVGAVAVHFSRCSVDVDLSDKGVDISIKSGDKVPDKEKKQEDEENKEKSKK